MEPSGRDPDVSRCDSGRSPQERQRAASRGRKEKRDPPCSEEEYKKRRRRAQGKRASRLLGVQEQRRASRRSPTNRPRRSTADRFRDMEETEVRLLSRAPGRCRTTAVRSLGKTEMRVRLPPSAPEPSPLRERVDAEKRRTTPEETRIDRWPHPVANRAARSDRALRGQHPPLPPNLGKRCGRAGAVASRAS